MKENTAGSDYIVGGGWGGYGGSVEVGGGASDTRGDNHVVCTVSLRAVLFATTLAGAGQCVMSASAEAFVCRCAAFARGGRAGPTDVQPSC